MSVRVQRQSIDIGAEIAAVCAGKPRIGAVASFVGLMRDLNDGESVASMHLEHYPGMTEAALVDIVAQARSRWELDEVRIIHRYGELRPTDAIVLVVVASTHRAAAFAACEFIMDFLKTDAPFWKKETTQRGTRWVDARDSDEAARRRWSDSQNEESANDA
jgi:molybdopterin synthase catalytic subunit